jgi:hypothetical protein
MPSPLAFEGTTATAAAGANGRKVPLQKQQSTHQFSGLAAAKPKLQKQQNV